MVRTGSPSHGRTAAMPNAAERAAPCTLAVRYQQVRQATLALAAPLSAEDCQVQSMPDASPTKWHLAHVTWFFETFVLEANESEFRPFDARFRVLFNSYYQGVGAMHPRPHRGLLTRPTLAEVRQYREQVDERMLTLLQQRGDDAQLAQLVTLGLHHEQQHQELLLTDIKHALSFNPAGSAYAKRWPMARVQPQPLAWFGFEGGLVDLGHDAAADGPFSFDNELPRHRAYTAPYELASRPVTYGEYLAFMADGAYERPELWLSMGWDWVRSGQRKAPLYWRHQERTRRRDVAADRHADLNLDSHLERWSNHTLQGLVPLDPHTPVCHLSYFEADAYARWAGARLPTELEWELAARQSGGPVRGNFADGGAFHPLPQARAASEGPVQLWGDVWEWTQSNYNAYPGYRPEAGAVGEYNGKFMCNQMVLRGGSCATPAEHVRASYRNFFPPEAQWQFSGLRLARDA
jgi:ergothioneine biosynthesis protein EgtB